MNKPDKAPLPKADKSKTEQVKNQKPEQGKSATNFGSNKGSLKDQKKR